MCDTKKIPLSLIFLFSVLGAFSTTINPAKPALVAERNGHFKYYKNGDDLTIVDASLQKWKGKLIAIDKDSITIKLFKTKTTVTIAITTIQSVMKLGRKGRTIALVSTIFYAAALLRFLTTVRYDDTIGGAEILGYLSGIFGGVFLGCFWLLTFPAQIIGRHQVKKGWKFYARVLEKTS
jgi:hypothetical protein